MAVLRLMCLLAIMNASSAFSASVAPSLRTSRPGLCSVSSSMYNTIHEKLTEGLEPVKLVVVDNSHQHAGHAGVNGRSGETHFAVEVVSNKFEGLRAVKRHQLVYGLLKEEMEGGRDAGGIHALEIKAKTEDEDIATA
eukprot:CAMPEP_0181319450 /NCGR_PEP_ID=MMETSP1101-20121128/17578_1 /TAXON_ID=46948 /ORGANISM="Rhodomonas abbreviata, Strain Caron Lab Isolate" /LENGTH=137 /DNA_ID=CAMNT_0023427051 /DNA_START=12 /DNA_END=425 /DNA_ORIENTATION=+